LYDSWCKVLKKGFKKKGGFELHRNPNQKHFCKIHYMHMAHRIVYERVS